MKTIDKKESTPPLFVRTAETREKSKGKLPETPDTVLLSPVCVCFPVAFWLEEESQPAVGHSASGLASSVCPGSSSCKFLRVSWRRSKATPCP